MEQLLSILNNQKIEHEILKHSEKIHSAQEGADYFGIELGQTAPTLILKTDRGYYSLILSGDYGRVDFEALKGLLEFEEVKLAKPQEVEQVTGCKIGDVSLVNPDIPTIMDRGLLRFPYIYGGTGVPQTTLKINPQDVEKLNDVVGYLR
ncbi:YbaK/prolyl-tRNA synthetase associated region [Paenibacillus curdlanolyticus YK9]|uniref:YbaK/prolyl-tRNA synthetase associated region n=1 Tax=Paenibacillus curdlanolyticus YK9 TaxID=717606 RepID=E0I5Y6_9BACL|nr:YbaK/EbsC family protein [Paenibacillus curdlanolyticus]EFM12378.1 YbaK/prolyl-tRNA synthetase associated region [Paenibacillus curdlanolyticus YK9]